MARTADPRDPSTDEILTVPQVANMLHKGSNTIYMLCERRSLPHFRVGQSIRFRRSRLIAWMEEQENAA